MTSSNRIAPFARAFALFTLIAIFAAAALPSASFASSARTRIPATTSPAAMGKVNILVTDQNTGKPIQGAEVAFRNADSGLIVTKGLTDQTGSITVELPVGSYVINVFARNYIKGSAVVIAEAGTLTVAKVALSPDSRLATPPVPALSVR
jgi:5-hydroxyisourate hydrolase-like protein (transthyretin family)